MQNVGFRASASECADGWAVTGWVRNEPDGTVLMEVQGERSEIEGMIGRLRERMAGKIRGIDSTPMACIEGESGFVIARSR